MASKFDQFLKASWNATFSAQEAPRRENAADRRRRWSRPGPGGGGFRRGKQEPLRRRIRKEIRKKISGDLAFLFHTPSPVGRRIEEGCALVPPRQFIRTSGGSWGGLGGGLGRSWVFCGRLLGDLETGLLFFRLAFLESEFVEAGFFRK